MKNGYDANNWQEFRTDFNQGADAEYWWSYRIDYGGASPAKRARMIARRDAGDTQMLLVIFFEGSALINQYYGGQWTPLASDNTVSTADDVWYHVYVKTSGGHVEVWRRADTETDMTKVLETDIAAVTTGPKLFFDAAPGSVVHYDDIRVRNNDGDIRSFSDDFSDGDYTADPAWTVNGTWTVTGADNHMQNTVSGSSSWFRRAAPCEDFVLDFTYVNMDTSNNLHRVVVTATDLDSPNQDGVEAQFKSSGMQLFQKVNGTSTSLDYDGTSSVQGTKYRVRVVRDGSRVEVWRGAEDAPMTKVLESDAITVGGYDRLTFAVSAGAQFAVDDIVLGVDDPETVVYTHNAANELLAMDGPAALARFDYDAWGRTVTKRRVSGAATHRGPRAVAFV